MGQHRAGSNQREWEAGGWGVGGYWRAGGSHRFWNDIRADIFPLFFIALWVSLVSHYSSLPRIFKSVSLCQRIWFRSHVRPVSPEFLMCFLVLSSHRVLPPFSASFLRCCLLCFVFMDLWSYHWSTFFVSYLPISCLPLSHHPLFVNHYKYIFLWNAVIWWYAPLKHTMNWNEKSFKGFFQWFSIVFKRWLIHKKLDLEKIVQIWAAETKIPRLSWPNVFQVPKH